MQNIKTVECKQCEIVSAGDWEASTGKVGLTENDLDEMIENFNSGVRDVYINLSHDENLTKKVKDNLNVLALGWVSKLYRKGKKLLADFKQVPEDLKQVLEESEQRVDLSKFEILRVASVAASGFVAYALWSRVGFLPIAGFLILAIGLILRVRSVWSYIGLAAIAVALFFIMTSLGIPLGKI